MLMVLIIPVSVVIHYLPDHVIRYTYFALGQMALVSEIFTTSLLELSRTKQKMYVHSCSV